jgi:hypothetical protein
MKKHGIENDEDGEKENLDVKRPRRHHKESSTGSMVSNPQSAFAFVLSPMDQNENLYMHCNSS